MARHPRRPGGNAGGRRGGVQAPRGSASQGESNAGRRGGDRSGQAAAGKPVESGRQSPGERPCWLGPGSPRMWPRPRQGISEAEPPAWRTDGWDAGMKARRKSTRTPRYPARAPRRAEKGVGGPAQTHAAPSARTLCPRRLEQANPWSQKAGRRSPGSVEGVGGGAGGP